MFIDDLAARLVAQGVGTISSNIFLGSGARLPTLSDPMGQGPFLTLIETPGSGPTWVHNKPGANTRRPTAQVTARAMNYQNARTMIEAAFASLNGVWNTTINGVFYQKIVAKQDPGDIGLDDVKRRMLAFNVEAERSS